MRSADKSPKEAARLLKRRKSKVRGFQPGMRVMGDPGQFGKVIGPSADEVHVEVWWDAGTFELVSPNRLSHVKNERY